jgi:hypothetical protein
MGKAGYRMICGAPGKRRKRKTKQNKQQLQKLGLKAKKGRIQQKN